MANNIKYIEVLNSTNTLLSISAIDVLKQIFINVLK